MAKHNEIGALGETLAASYLEEKGYRIVYRNWRLGRREVDLIAEFEGQLVFVEVKTRSGTAYGFPEDFVDDRKMEFLREAAEIFLLDHTEWPTLRYDLVSILLKGKTVLEIRHFEDAFY